MEIQKLPYDAISQLASRDVAYIKEVPALRPFYKYAVSAASFAQVIADKGKDATDRPALVEALRRQYAQQSAAPAVEDNITSLLSPNTFTLVTAHQPSLFTGPLYYIYKIISAISLAERLNGQYPDNHFVPVFITSGEDHDFAEVNHLHLFGRTLSWESGESGPVGWMNTAGVLPVIESLRELLGTSESAQYILGLIAKAFSEGRPYDQAAFTLVHELFKAFGLVVLNTNDAQLKRCFAPAIREEILQQPSHRIVGETIANLERAGFPSQAFPRVINFFYMLPGLRERIVLENGLYRVLNTDLAFTPEAMEAEIESHPERFSPNVIMRPIYQETILPNLAYIGGGGELAYWLERKAQFDHFKLNFPMLIRRNSALWIDAASLKRLHKLDFSTEEIWEDAEALIKTYLQRHAESAFDLKDELQQLLPVFSALADKAEAVDATLVKTVWAEHARLLKSLEQLETRLVRAEKQRHETALQQIRQLKEKLFPGQGLQERHDNFLPLYLKHGPAFFELLKANFDPLEKQFVVFLEK
jgi:bacillithiol biosynthesis cysteine-adding enzyme BshC